MSWLVTIARELARAAVAELVGVIRRERRSAAPEPVNAWTPADTEKKRSDIAKATSHGTVQGGGKKDK